MWKLPIKREQPLVQLDANQVPFKALLILIFNVVSLQQLEQVAQTEHDICPSSVVAI